MRIKSHKLEAEPGEANIPYVDSPNQGGTITPKYLIIHYTAGSSARNAVSWLSNPQAKASAHLVIGLDGSITQLVPFNKVAWHAGISRWDGLSGLNSHSIGIELDNPGIMKKAGGSWIAWFGREYPDSVIVEATHKHMQTSAGWHIFTEAQLEACILVSQILVQEYNLKDILGHDDISPNRKIDPDPAFPMGSFKAKVMGRGDEQPEIYKVTTNDTKLRVGPGTNFNEIASLKKSTEVEFIKNHLRWRYLSVLDNEAEIMENEGWIHDSLLKKV